jgi:SAM-dependent methyltransferase
MGTKEILCSAAETLAFPDAAFSHVVALDVLQYLDDDVAALREYARVAGPGGIVIVTVPAYRWAWSDHDVALAHRRRYTARRLAQASTAAGLETMRVSYFHSWLVPVALALAKPPLRWIVRRPAEQVAFVSPRLNRLFVRLTAAERRWLRRGNLPAGLAVLLVGRVPGP